LGVSIDGSSISMDPQADAMFYQPPGAMPVAATQLMQLLTTLSATGPVAVAPPTQPVVAVVPNQPTAGPPGPPPSQPVTVAVPQPTTELETARQQLDASSRQLAAGLDDKWRQFLALPAEIYIPNHYPSMESIEQAVQRYEQVSEDPKFAALTSQPAFQTTLKGLWRMGEMLQGTQQKMRLPPPPVGTAKVQ
jgi:hypothetical protein